MALAIASSTAAAPVAASSLTFAHGSGSGDRRWLLVNARLYDSATGDAAQTISGVTYNGVALTAAVQAAEVYGPSATLAVRSEWWVLEAPASGSNDVVITASASVNSLSAVAVTLTDCGGLGANTATTNGNISAITCNLTTGEATSLILGGWGGQASRVVTAGTGVTLIVDVEDAGATDNSWQWVGEKAATGGADSWEITLGTATRSAGAAVEAVEDLGSAAPVTVNAAAGVAPVAGQGATVVATTTVNASPAAVTVSGITAGIQIGSVVTVNAMAGVVSVAGNTAAIVAGGVSVVAAPGVVLVAGPRATVDTVRYLYDLAVSDEAAYQIGLSDASPYSLVLGDGSIYSVELRDASRS